MHRFAERRLYLSNNTTKTVLKRTLCNSFLPYLRTVSFEKNYGCGHSPFTFDTKQIFCLWWKEQAVPILKREYEIRALNARFYRHILVLLFFFHSNQKPALKQAALILISDREKSLPWTCSHEKWHKKARDTLEEEVPSPLIIIYKEQTVPGGRAGSREIELGNIRAGLCFFRGYSWCWMQIYN